MKINGTLRNARRLSKSEHFRGPCLQGRVYGDTKGRFRDGAVIVTSTIEEEFPETGIFKTRYSVYKVESWADAPKAANDNGSLTVTQHLLSCLAEECTEVGQRVSKALRFGLGEIQPGQSLTNAQRIAGEATDLLAVLEMLEERGVFVIDRSPEALTAKHAKVEKFMAYARTQGALAA